MIEMLKCRIGVQSVIEVNKIDTNYILEMIYMNKDGNIVSYENTFKKNSLVDIHTLM